MKQMNRSLTIAKRRAREAHTHFSRKWNCGQNTEIEYTKTNGKNTNNGKSCGLQEAWREWVCVCVRQQILGYNVSK